MTDQDLEGCDSGLQLLNNLRRSYARGEESGKWLSYYHDSRDWGEHIRHCEQCQQAGLTEMSHLPATA